MAIPSSGRLATIRSKGGFEYKITRDDVLWLARMAAYEGGSAADSLWALAQRFVWFDEAKSIFYPTFGDLAQAFSQPINPKWQADGEFCVPGGKYHGTKWCSEGRLQRRAEARAASFDELKAKEPEAMDLVVLWAEGRVQNPVPGATNWAAPGVAQGYLERNPNAELRLKRGNWFIAEPESVSWPDDYVYMESTPGMVADASGVYRPSFGRAFARGVARAATRWWRLV